MNIATLQKPLCTEPSVEFLNQMKNDSHNRRVICSDVPHKAKQLTRQLQSPIQESYVVLFFFSSPYSKWFTHDNSLSLQKKQTKTKQGTGKVTSTQAKQEETIRPSLILEKHRHQIQILAHVRKPQLCTK